MTKEKDMTDKEKRVLDKMLRYGQRYGIKDITLAEVFKNKEVKK